MRRNMILMLLWIRFGPSFLKSLKNTWQVLHSFSRDASEYKRKVKRLLKLLHLRQITYKKLSMVRSLTERKQATKSRKTKKRLASPLMSTTADCLRSQAISNTTIGVLSKARQKHFWNFLTFQKISFMRRRSMPCSCL